MCERVEWERRSRGEVKAKSKVGRRTKSCNKGGTKGMNNGYEGETGTGEGATRRKESWEDRGRR